MTTPTANAQRQRASGLYVTVRLRMYRGGEKGPQGSGTNTVSICVAWTHRGVERYAGVFPCVRRSKTHPKKHQFLTQNVFLGPGCLIWQLTRSQEIHNTNYLNNIQ
jgi:hypothetical protein